MRGRGGGRVGVRGAWRELGDSGEGGWETVRGLWARGEGRGGENGGRQSLVRAW